MCVCTWGDSLSFFTSVWKFKWIRNSSESFAQQQIWKWIISTSANKSLLNRKELDTDFHVNSNLTLIRVCELKELLLDGCEHQRWSVTGERNWASVCVRVRVCARASGCVCACTWGDSISSFTSVWKLKWIRNSSESFAQQQIWKWIISQKLWTTDRLTVSTSANKSLLNERAGLYWYSSWQ